MFLACPDFKGIKTCPGGVRGASRPFLACPDFKGIKTDVAVVFVRDGKRFWPALISKGLRPSVSRRVAARMRFLACPDFKGIKTLRWPSKLSFSLFLACPDFKGIKTYQWTYQEQDLNVSGLP